MVSGNKTDKIANNIVAIFPTIFKRIIKGHNNDGKLHPPLHLILGLLIEYGPMPISEIGNKLCISKPNMTALIDKLIEDKYAKRHPDLEDRRIIKIEITSKGIKQMKKSRACIRANIKETLSKLNKEDLEKLDNAIEDARTILAKI